MFGRVRAKQGVGEQAWFVPNTFGRSESPQENLAIFTPTYVRVRTKG